MRLRGFAEIDIDPILDRLEAENSLNSVRFAEQYVHSRTTRGFGPLKIIRELLDRGVERAQAEDAIQAWSGNWDSLLVEVYRKRYAETVATSQAERAKRVRYLSRRGFSIAGIVRLLSSQESPHSPRVE